MSGRKYKKTNKFVLAMVIYALIAVLAGIAGMKVLFGILEEYEAAAQASKLSLYVEDFKSGFGEDNLRNSTDTAEFIAELPRDIMSDEQYMDTILGKVMGELELEKNAKESSSSSVCYRMLLNGTPVGSVRFEKNIELGYGYLGWEKTEEHYDLSFLLRNEYILAPAGYSVKVNGVLLDESFVDSSEKIDVYENVRELVELEDPVLLTYNVNVIDDVKVDVYNDMGELVPEENRNKDGYIHMRHDICPEEEAAAIRELAAKFAERFTDFSSGVGNLYSKKDQVMQCVVARSNLAKRLDAALDGYTHVHPLKYSFEMCQIDVYQVVKIDDENYFCDMRYSFEVDSETGEHQTITNDVRLLIVQNRYLKITDMLPVISVG